MTRVRFCCNNMGSSGLRLLNKTLQDSGINSLIIKHNNSKYIPKDTDLIINWGVPKHPLPLPNILNKNSRNAANKLTAFQLMVRNKLRWTTDKEEAKTFKLCYCRTLLSSSQGRGIVVATSPEEVVDAPLYTKGIIKVGGEYRVHVFQGNIIDVVQKKRRIDYEGEISKTIRNYENGWIFAREDINVPERVLVVAKEAVEDLQLDFGAVDVVFSNYSHEAFVLEVNTAPGMQGTTVESYSNAIIGGL